MSGINIGAEQYRSRGNWVGFRIVLGSLFFLTISASLMPDRLRAEELHRSSWESDDIYSGTGWKKSGKAAELSGDHACLGTRSIKFSLNYLTDDPMRYRSELSLTDASVNPLSLQRLAIGRTYWISFAIFIPSSHGQHDKWHKTVLQLYPTADKGETSSRSIAAINYRNDQWAIQLRYNTSAFDPEGADMRTALDKDIGRYETDRWTNFVLKYTVRADEQGELIVWIDGRQAVLYKGPSAFSDARGPYIKTGLYIPAWRYRHKWGGIDQNVKSRLHYMDDFRVSLGDYGLGEMSSVCGDDDRSAEPLRTPSGLAISR